LVSSILDPLIFLFHLSEKILIMGSFVVKPTSPRYAVTISPSLLSCAPGIQSYSTKAKDADLKKFKSYAWIRPADAENRKYDSVDAAQILEPASEELVKKGFVLNTEDLLRLKYLLISAPIREQC